MEMLYALSYLVHKLVDEFSAARHIVNEQHDYSLAAGCVHTVMTDHVFSWLDATATRRMVKLDLHHMASGMGGQAMLEMFHEKHKATEVFPWTMVAKEVIRGDTQTRAARQADVHMNSTAEYGVTPSYSRREFASRSAWGAATDNKRTSPAAAAQEDGGLFHRGTRPVGGTSRTIASPSRRGLRYPVREKRVFSASERKRRPQLQDGLTSVGAFQRATALFANTPSRRRSG